MIMDYLSGHKGADIRRWASKDKVLRWCNANARRRDVLAAERKERSRVHSEKGIRWGGRTLTPAT